MLSFIVPAYNEEFELPTTLSSIRKAAGARRHEVIVVDDASTDRTAQIAAKFGARVVHINRRQIAAARNAGAQVASGDVLFFVDADTRINYQHIVGAIAALEAGYAGGSARADVDGVIPIWARMFFRIFCALYFAMNLGAGAFLFTTRQNFDRVGGFDEELFAGEEVYFSMSLKTVGRFKILDEPIITSGRKLRMYSGLQIFGKLLGLFLRGPSAVRSRTGLEIWYEGKREKPMTGALIQSDAADIT